MKKYIREGCIVMNAMNEMMQTQDEVAKYLDANNAVDAEDADGQETLDTRNALSESLVEYVEQNTNLTAERTHVSTLSQMNGHVSTAEAFTSPELTGCDCIEVHTDGKTAIVTLVLVNKINSFSEWSEEIVEIRHDDEQTLADAVEELVP
jgi:hypothetical protein